MAATQINTGQIFDGGVQRNDLCTTLAGKSVIAKMVTDPRGGLVLTSTGGDTGTGDVTLKAKSLFEAAATAVAIGATDTYLSGSLITIPAGDLAVGCCYHALIHTSKTGAGTGQIIFTFRAGTLGSISDLAVFTATLTAGTAAADTGLMEFWTYFTNISTIGGVSSVLNLYHNLPTTGLWNTGNQMLIGSLTPSANFNVTTPTKLACSYKGDTGNHTVSVLKAELLYP